MTEPDHGIVMLMVLILTAHLFCIAYTLTACVTAPVGYEAHHGFCLGPEPEAAELPTG